MYIRKDPLLFQAAKSQRGDLGNAVTEGLNKRGLRGKLNEEAFAIFLRSGLAGWVINPGSHLFPTHKPTKLS